MEWTIDLKFVLFWCMNDFNATYSPLHTTLAGSEPALLVTQAALLQYLNMAKT